MMHARMHDDGWDVVVVDDDGMMALKHCGGWMVMQQLIRARVPVLGCGMPVVVP